MEKHSFGIQSEKKLNTDKVILISFSLVIAITFIFSLSKLLRVDLEWSMGNLSGGIINIYNQIADALGKSSYFLLVKKSGASQGNLMVFILLVTITSLVIYQVISRWRFRLLFVAPATIVFLGTLFKLDIEQNSFVFLVFIIALLIVSKNNNELSIYRVKCFAKFFICALTIFFFLTKVEPINKNLRVPETANNLKEYTIEKISEFYYGKSPLGYGDLSKLNREDDKSTAIKISMEKPDSIYLRGFVGENFHLGKWQALENKSHYENINLMYWLNKEGFSPFSQLANARSVTLGDSEEKLGKVKIENVGADKGIAYIPYEVDQKVNIGKSYSDSFIENRGIGKLDDYEFNLGSSNSYNWTDTAGRIFTESDESLKGEIDKWLRLESHYNKLVYDKYLHIDDSDRILLYKELGKSPDSANGHMDYKEAIDKVKNYLNEKYVYTNKLPVEFNEEFKSPLERLFKEKKGYDVHYATLSALIFRYYGIPARYVEGYVVTKEDAEKMKSGEIFEIPRTNAHGWCEIYIDGLGFVPLEVDPIYSKQMKSADLTVGITNNPLSYNTPDEKIRDTKEESTSNNNESLVDKIGSYLGIVLFILILILIVLMIGRFVYKRIIPKRKIRKAIFKSNPKESVCLIYDDLFKRKYSISSDQEQLFLLAAYSDKEISKENKDISISYWKKANKELKRDFRKTFLSKIFKPFNKNRNMKTMKCREGAYFK